MVAMVRTFVLFIVLASCTAAPTVLAATLPKGSVSDGPSQTYWWSVTLLATDHEDHSAGLSWVQWSMINTLREAGARCITPPRTFPTIAK